MLVQKNPNLFFQKLQHKVMSFLYQNDLTKLLPLYHSKWNPHLFGQHYQEHFAPLRKKKLKILEIGVRGYDDPESDGNSLRMWKHYFPKSMIYGIDIIDKKALEEDRIKISCY